MHPPLVSGNTITCTPSEFSTIRSQRSSTFSHVHYSGYLDIKISFKSLVPVFYHHGKRHVSILCKDFLFCNVQAETNGVLGVPVGAHPVPELHYIVVYHSPDSLGVRALIACVM